MDKTAIKNFAVRARNKLIDDITQKAFELGISEDEIKDIIAFEGGFTIKGLNNSKTYKKYQEKQRRKLVDNIKQKGFDQVIEEVAYTWFNRFIALRFMEVNDYLPTGVRVLSSEEEGKVEPDIIKEALNADLDIDRELVYKLIDENDTEDLYRYLLVKQCNELGEIMPQVFEEISDYTELLLPDNLLGEGSVIRDLVDSVEEEDYKDQVEIIGWMYQYYISEKKDEVFAGLKKNKKITKENIPAATQLFTPKWIVKYMIENSLGRLWLESHPDEDLQSKWKYYLEEAEQEPEVRKQLDELKYPNQNPEDIKVLDPSMGSGHILVHAFDVLYDIYLKANYSERDIPRLILEKNLYGLDIDDRAGQLSAFALIMKARSRNRRIFRRKIELNVCSIQESNGISKEAIDYFVNTEDTSIDKDSLRKDVGYLIKVFHDAKEYGSILDVEKVGFDAIERRIEEIKDGDTANLFELEYKEAIIEKLPSLVKQGRIMSEKYDVVCTNPPYMGNMPVKMTDYVIENYVDSKYDLYSVFMKKGFDLLKENGYQAMVTGESWLFLKSFEKMRKNYIKQYRLVSLNHLGTGAFEGGFGTVAFIFSKQKIKYYKTKCVALNNVNTGDKHKEFNLLKKKKRFIICDVVNLLKVPGAPLAYWISDNIINSFNNKDLSSVITTKAGIVTGNNEKFMRLWFEVDFNKVEFNAKDYSEFQKLKWVPTHKGGGYRKWYGNLEYIVNIKDIWDDSKVNKSVRRGDVNYYFKEGITWSTLANILGARKSDSGFVCDTKGSMAFPAKHIDYILGLINSKFTSVIMGILSPTLDFNKGYIEKIPYKYTPNERIEKYVSNNIEISRFDWNSFETSWDFRHHPLLTYSSIKNNFDADKIKNAFNQWSDFTNQQFARLKFNEEELNRIFIDIYGLQDELTPEVDDKDVVITRIYDTKEDIPEKGNSYVLTREDVIKSFISYAVGCMFGRYSLDEEGLIYAGGEFDINRYETFIPTSDNVLVIADDDYFEDDIVSRFVDFVRITFGGEALEENLEYIAESLGQRARETARQTIRRYFLKDFYKDHVKTYKKRPIYWEFNSGRQDGFKALIYMHRYDLYTVSRVRTDYLHKLQRMYEAEIDRLDMYLENPDITPREKSASTKKKQGLLKQIEECLAYDQVIGHVANQKIDIDLDDGVKVNYAKFQGIEVPQGEGRKPLKANLISKI